MKLLTSNLQYVIPLILAVISVGSCASMISDESESPVLIAEKPPLRVMTYNTWYVFAERRKIELGKSWVKSQAPDVVALQELTNIKDEFLQTLADGWGHKHSCLLKTSGFSVGLTSRWPIEVIEKLRKGLHHGCLVAKTNGIYYFVVHLSPFKWKVRIREADIILSKVNTLIAADEKVILLGDFNAFTPADKNILESNPKLVTDMKKVDKKHGHVENLKNGQIDYSVIQKFLDAELTDVADELLPMTPEQRLTLPTSIWTDKKSSIKLGQRVDYILVSQNLAKRAKSVAIIKEGVVNEISDHYPVVAEFKN